MPEAKTVEPSVLILEAQNNFQAIMQQVVWSSTRNFVVVNSAEKALAQLSEKNFDTVILADLEGSLDVLAQAVQQNPVGGFIFFSNDEKNQEVAKSIAPDVKVAPRAQYELVTPIMELLPPRTKKSLHS